MEALFLSTLVLLPPNLLIEQLGAEHYAKREQTYHYLGRLLANTNGCSNQHFMSAVKEATRSHDREVARRATRLYENNRQLYFQETGQFVVFANVPADEISVRILHSMPILQCSYWRYRYQDMTSAQSLIVFCFPEGASFSSADRDRLLELPGVLSIRPISDRDIGKIADDEDGWRDTGICRHEP